VDTVDAFSFWEGARAFIFLGADRGSACRSRFDAAHELGHLVLHRGIDEEELEADLKQIEREADRFASAFVLPSTTYPLEIFSTRLSAFKELKRRWKVSIAAQIYRCSDLMLLSEEQVLNLRKQLSANRWRKTEPLDDEILLEQSRVLEKSLELVLGHTDQRPEDILLALRLSRETVEALLGAQLPGSPEPPDPSPTVRLKII
jgi:Zn-dependent peptidase ImmA (M78 family)